MYFVSFNTQHEMRITEESCRYLAISEDYLVGGSRRKKSVMSSYGRLPGNMPSYSSPIHKQFTLCAQCPHRRTSAGSSGWKAPQSILSGLG